MVPVVLTSGKVAYENVTVSLEVTESTGGAITITAGTVTLVTAPVGKADGFIAGTYYGPGSSAATPTVALTLSGPGVTTGGATEWSIAQNPSSEDCTYPTSATFYVGTLASNPLSARLKKAGITSTAYSYGLLGAAVCGSQWWGSGGLLGFSQTGKAITIVSFTFAGTDQATPRAQVTYVE